ncbi:MAG: aryl-sulfate sulfotransferase [Ignavibacteriaceae bacterium]
MKYFFTTMFFILLINFLVFAQEDFQYISPKNNAKLVSLSTSIIAGASDKIDFANIPENVINIQGEKSGKHTVKIKLSDDGKTIIFSPINKFEPNEKVSVVINSGVKTIEGKSLSSVSFNFTTTPLAEPIRIDPRLTIGNVMPDQNVLYKNSIKSYNKLSNVESDTLPSDFPTVTVDSVNNPSPGKFFLANFGFGGANFLMIVNNDGSVDKYKRLNSLGLDFKVQPDGDLSYAEVIRIAGGAWQSRYIILDSTLAAVDTFQCGNGYVADVHDFKLLPNGHAVLIATDPEPMDMSQYGGNPNATVLGCIVQELDASKNVIFQWRSWAYIPITDSYYDLTTKTVDYFHQNAVDVDRDGNFLLSSRNLSQIIKIDRNTGNIIWKLGGKENDFTFINEHEENSPTYFSYQHDIAVLPNGDVTLFDNGNQHSTQYSRAVEYKLDQVNKTAELVWDYRHSPDIFAPAMGSVQRLPNGNTLVGWGGAGSAAGNPILTEVHPDKSVAFEMSFPANQTSYRAFKFPWNGLGPSVSVINYDVLQGNTYEFDDANDTTGIAIKFDSLNALPYNDITASVFNFSAMNPVFNTNAPLVKKVYFTLNGNAINYFQGQARVNLIYYPEIANPNNIIVYTRPDKDSVFSPLATSYDSVKNELMFSVSNFGDYIFGIPLTVDSAYAPEPIKPQDEKIVNQDSPVKLFWGTKGIVANYQLEVATDSLFSSLVVDDTLSATSYELSGLDNDTRYFWRVRATNSSGESDWSEAFNFLTAAPFITVVYPNGNEEFLGDSTYIIRWKDNLTGLVNINLILNDTVSMSIADSVLSVTNAYQWTVPDSLQRDSSYKIEIADVADNNIFDSSDENFFINTVAVGVNEVAGIVKKYRLYQNYPNPFNPSTVIKYDLPAISNVSISIFNVIGQRVAVLINRVQNAGAHSVIWNAQNIASGVYFYRIKATGINSKNDFISYKKAVLIK